MNQLKKAGKCFVGLKEFYLDSDGTAIICNAHNLNKTSYGGNIKDYNLDLLKLFRSKSVRTLRKNCKRCPIRCQQMVYFNPHWDNLPLIIKDLIVLYVKYFYFKIFPKTFK